jgi:hypothetical protein
MSAPLSCSLKVAVTAPRWNIVDPSAAQAMHAHHAQLNHLVTLNIDGHQYEQKALRPYHASMQAIHLEKDPKSDDICNELSKPCGSTFGR